MVFALYVQDGKCEMVSRNGNIFKTFPQLVASIQEGLDVKEAIIDGRDRVPG
jgi:ATP-dependent DNA ligase